MISRCGFLFELLVAFLATTVVCRSEFSPTSTSLEENPRSFKEQVLANQDEILTQLKAQEAIINSLQQCTKMENIEEIESTQNQTEADNPCVRPYIKADGVGCIHFVYDRMNWTDARNNCQSIGGDLFVATDKDHILQLAKYIKNHPPIDYIQWIWTGVISRAWLDGRQVATDEWGKGQPKHDSDDCGGTGTWSDYLIWDWTCTYNGASLCQQAD